MPNFGRSIAFSALRIDAYLSIVLDHPPSVRYYELCIPLPKSPQLWEAPTEPERRRLQWNEPAGREKALFGYLMRDALLIESAEDGAGQQRQPLPYRLTALDRHLGLCAMQSGCWQAAREAHSAASDELVTKLTPGSPIQLWRAHLSVWRQGMEDECGMTARLFQDVSDQSNAESRAIGRAQARSEDHARTSTSEQENSGPSVDPEHCLDLITLTLWHIASLKMHAPLNLLRMYRTGHGNGVVRRAADGLSAAVHKPNARMRTWMASHCPRIAVWNAAQISQAFMRGFQDVLSVAEHGNGVRDVSSPTSSTPPTSCILNPLAVPGLMMSAIVVLAYASQTEACGTCRVTTLQQGEEHHGAVDIFSAVNDNPALVAWKDRGHGSAVWGTSGIVVCRCQRHELYRWFSRVLTRDEDALKELEQIQHGLCTE